MGILTWVRLSPSAGRWSGTYDWFSRARCSSPRGEQVSVKNYRCGVGSRSRVEWRLVGPLLMAMLFAAGCSGSSESGAPGNDASNPDDSSSNDGSTDSRSLSDGVAPTDAGSMDSRSPIDGAA